MKSSTNERGQRWIPLLPTFFVIFAFMAGVVLKGPEKDPDSYFSLPERLGVFLVFLGWMGAILEWGAVFSRALALTRLQPLSAIVLGGFFASISSALLGHLGLIGDRFTVLAYAVLLLGTLLNLRHRILGISDAQPTSAFQGLDRSFIVFLAALLIIPFWNSWAPQLQGDPLYYQILGPKVWHDAGRIATIRENPLLYHASYWEYIYLWANALVGASGSFGLIEVQVFCQWIHLFLGFLPVGLALCFLFKPAQSNRIWLILIAASGMTSGSTLWTAVLAKNDWGLISWVLFGTLLLLEETVDKRWGLLAGLLFGAAIANKFPHVYFVSFLIFVLCFSRYRRIILPTCIGVIASLGPIWIRNAVELGNPLYPLLNSFFRGTSIGPSMEMYNENFLLTRSDMNVAHYAETLKALLQENPFLYLAILSPLASKPSERGRVWRVAQALVLVFLAFTLSVGKIMFWRYSGVFPILASAVVVYSWSRIKIIPRLMLQLVCVGVLLFQITQTDFFKPQSSPRAQLAEEVRKQLGGDSKAWLRLNAKKDSLTVSTYDPQIYYLSGMKVALLEFDPELDRATFSATSPKQICEAITKIYPGATYFLETWLPALGGAPWGKRMTLLRPLLHKHPEVFRYYGRESRVIDFPAFCKLAGSDSIGSVKSNLAVPLFTP